MKKIIFILCFLTASFSFSQEKGAIFIELNSSYNTVKTLNLDDYYDKYVLSSPTTIEILKRNNYQYDFGLNVNYQIAKAFSIGIYGKYIVRNSSLKIHSLSYDESKDALIDTIFSNGFPHFLRHTIIGIHSEFSLNQLTFWPMENWLSRLETKLSFGIGYSYSRFINFVNTFGTKMIDGFSGEINPVSGIHLMGNLKIGYQLSNNLLFSSIGIQVGFQYLMTKRLRGDELITFKKDDTPNLNFYGLTSGIYLTIGK